MTPTFSILHATYKRPQKAVEAMRAWFEKSSGTHSIEYIFAANSDDPTLPDLKQALMDADIRTLDGSSPGHIVSDVFKGSAEAWDRAAKVSRGKILIQGQDDVEPPSNWDERLLDRVTQRVSGDGDPILQPFFIQVSDGYRTDELMCTAIMSRDYFYQKGEFLHAGYISVYSDDEFTIRAMADCAAGKVQRVDAKDIVFRHRHHYHDKSVPMDETYERENSIEAYSKGRELFLYRNNHLIFKK